MIKIKSPRSFTQGKPILGAFSNETNMLLAMAVWWAIFYSPGDVAYQVVMTVMIIVIM